MSTSTTGRRTATALPIPRRKATATTTGGLRSSTRYRRRPARSVRCTNPSFRSPIPRWSPDGKQIAFIGGIMSDEGSVGGDIFAVPATGGAAASQPDAGPQEFAELAALASFRKDSFHRRRSTEAPRLPHSIRRRGGWRPLWTGEESLRAGDDAFPRRAMAGRWRRCAVRGRLRLRSGRGRSANGPVASAYACERCAEAALGQERKTCTGGATISTCRAG